MPIKPEFVVELSGKSYPLYAGVLAEAHERGLREIRTELVQIPSQENDFTAIVKATVVMETVDGDKDMGINRIVRTFDDYGDASPRNTSARMATALIRFASTRAKGRALRDAINCGQTLLEELPSLDETDAPAPGKARAHAAVTAAETETATARVSRPAPPPPKPASDPAPGFEPWFETGNKKMQRVSLVSTCQADQFLAQEQGLPVEALDPEKATNEQLYAYGRNLRAKLKAAKDAGEIAEAQAVQSAGVRQ